MLDGKVLGCIRSARPLWGKMTSDQTSLYLLGAGSSSSHQFNPCLLYCQKRAWNDNKYLQCKIKMTAMRENPCHHTGQHFLDGPLNGTFVWLDETLWHSLESNPADLQDSCFYSAAWCCWGVEVVGTERGAQGTILGSCWKLSTEPVTFQGETRLKPRLDSDCGIQCCFKQKCV